MIVRLRPRYKAGFTQPPTADVLHIGVTGCYFNTPYTFPYLIHILFVFHNRIFFSSTCKTTYILFQSDDSIEHDAIFKLHSDRQFYFYLKPEISEVSLVFDKLYQVKLLRVPHKGWESTSPGIAVALITFGNANPISISDDVRVL